jgi:phage terminase small subunit
MLYMHQKEVAIKVHEDLPAFIIGLPKDSFEADLAKSKFAETVGFLKKIVPEIEEARCKIKQRDITGERKRYEVDASVITPYARHSYVNSGWDLAKMFNEMDESLKKTFAHDNESKRHKLPAKRGLGETNPKQ